MAEGNAKTCFIVMPMSDGDPYPPNHWDRVYDELFVPACEKAEFKVDRADSYKNTALIMADVLRRLHKADMVVCDLSSLRPNVMFELGLRQAFDQPVVLAIDERTPRPFDISQLRDVSYDSSLRFDLVRKNIDAFADAIGETYERRATGEFSLVRLLEIGAAQPVKPASEEAMQRAMVAAIDRLTAEINTLKSGILVPLQTVPGNFTVTFPGSGSQAMPAGAQGPQNRLVGGHPVGAQTLG